MINDLRERIEGMDWSRAAADLNARGYALLPEVLSEAECETCIAQYDDPSLYRKTIVMERYRFGKGEYKYFHYPLPGLIQGIRELAYPKLAPLANEWMKALSMDRTFPDTFQGLQQLCEAHQQTKATALILRYGKGGYNTLHQDLYGEVFFPFQLVLFLNDPEKDYKGGAFVLTEQVPRAQSKAMVLQPRKGEMLIFTTNFRPVRGSRGYYRAAMRHGVSELHEGIRHTLGIIFHDAL